MTTKLLPLQKDILAVALNDSSLSYAEIAKKIGSRASTVRYHLETLRSNQVISPTTFINIYALGYRYFNVCFSLSGESSKQRQTLLTYLIKSPVIAWIAEVSGDYHFEICLVTKSLEGALAELRKLSAKFPNLFFDKSYSFHASLVFFPKKYLSDKTYTPVRAGYFKIKEEHQADEFDEQIVSLLSHQPQLSCRELAKTLNRSHSTVEFRCKQLEKAGVIQGYGYNLDTRKIGHQIFQLLIFAKGLDAELGRELFQFARQHDNIVYFSECLGNWDYEMGVEAENPAVVSAITQQLYEKFGNSLNAVKNVSIVKTYKTCQYPM